MWHIVNVCLKHEDDKVHYSSAGKVAPGFGIGALEELDAEDEDVFTSGWYRFCNQFITLCNPHLF